ncbi:hypothetical protein DICSQDRAFT_129360 [Dichomitus squalens LYAD-421 SS1]|uniref:Zn(2)-C6 fungal-type domain-containing protein n=1 Tax=Dichomitus squalens (strain LYAD-421) TaxID=732165 RepID=R7SPH5_DICSQ|nr:uncharacterized protein DICSQDRAFT_129360 [Dichomitus squalens LYAD-421 SS1]EJF57630.1 hypothetical protein DICSQDRAFT_129360 [Dichomitus squalens LYAD-421 SS1]
MADLEFVIEAPQVTRTNKKRPRLVTSCDHCRVKKIKCVQQPASGKCEACSSANLACLYRDREQYFAERTRMLSGAGSALRDASTNGQNRAHLSAINASTPTSSRGPTPPHLSRGGSSASSSPDRSYSPSFLDDMGISFLDNKLQDFNGGFDCQLSMPTWKDPIQPLPWSSARYSPDMLGTDLSMQLPQLSSYPSPLLGLFDASDHQHPHPNLMMSFLTVFFEKLGPAYPFLSSGNICERFLHRRLSPLLANAIAASAARFSTVNEIVQIGPANASDVYCQVTKSLIPLPGAHTTIETLHAVMLLAWVEYKRGRQAMFNDYARMVTRLAADLGISNETLPQLTRVSDPQSARVFQSTWQGIQLLERTLLAMELVALSGSTLGRQHSSAAAYEQPSLW